MRLVLLIIGVVLTVLATLPYIRDVLKKKTKPRIVSWFNWALLAGISGAAALAAKQYPAAALSLSASAECLLIMVFGLKLGDRKFEFFDVACQAGAIAGFVLWIIFNNPLIAIIASVMIDVVVSLPTLRHVWQKPREETPSLFILSAIAAAFVLSAVHNPRLAGLIMPIYIIVIDHLTFGLFHVSPNRHQQPEPLWLI